MPRARTTSLEAAHPAAAAFTAAVKLLGHRPRSRAALLRLLVGKGHAAPDAAAAVSRCEDLGYLREQDLARSQARALLEAGHAPESVLERLLAKELDPPTARAAIAAEVSESGWRADAAAARQLARKRLTGARAVRWLLSRGFDEGVARRAAGFDEE
jgi:SOS response regulatory protein OraA/RecX